MLDPHQAKNSFYPTEVEHMYGENVHIVSDPLASTQLARLCSDKTVQPEVNNLVEQLYRSLVHHVVNAEFPRKRQSFTSRMHAGMSEPYKSEQRGIIEADLIDDEVPVVTVDIARAGILPSLTCYNLFNQIQDPSVVRQDHIIMSRAVDDSDHVVGARINGEKIGGPVDGRIVIFPDPMGATGTSLSTAISYYKDNFGGEPAKVITLNLIVTPQFIRRISEDHPEVIMYSLRLDRGMSSPEVLQTVPGSRWDEESGLDSHDYIVPGGGGFGEIMNNAWV